MTSINRISFLIVAAAWIICTVLQSINSETIIKNSNETTPQPLPEESEIWPIIRDTKHLYIDKTKYLKDLISSGFQTAFINRPRRFGKSLFLEMMEHFFAGRNELFHGLFINDYGNTLGFLKLKIQICGRKKVSKWMKYPIIYLDFTSLTCATQTTFEVIFNRMLVSAAKQNNVDFTKAKDKTISSLITLLYETKKMPVILLIDEYDKPIQEALLNNNKKLEAYLRNEFENKIFTHVKASKRELGFTFMVGVSKIPYRILQSGANNFQDFSYDTRFAQAFGFTQEEIKNNMMIHLEEFSKQTEISTDDIIDDLFGNYNGYCFEKEGCNNSTSVLNPISTLKSLTYKRFANYWYQTCSVKHVARTFYKYANRWHVNDFETGYAINEIQLFARSHNAFLDNNFPIYLFLFGYVTINKYDSKKGEIILTYPNKEVKDAVQEELIHYVPFADDMISSCREQNQKFFTAMYNGNFKAAMKLLQEYAFIHFQHPSADNVSPQEITRRFYLILYHSNIKFREGVTFNKDGNEMQNAGDIDFLTLNLKINILISIKCSIHAGGMGKKALNQLTGYYKDHPKNLIGAVEKLHVKTEYLYFIGIGFHLREVGEINEWVVLPLKKKNFDYTHVEAYPETLKKHYKKT